MTEQEKTKEEIETAIKCANDTPLASELISRLFEKIEGGDNDE